MTLATALLAACSSVAVPPVGVPVLPAAYPQAAPARTGGPASGAAQDGPSASGVPAPVPPQAPAARWWEALHDPVLDRLIATAQERNHDVRLALARVQQARAVLPAVDSRRSPAVNLGGDLADVRSGLPAQVKFGMPDTRAAQLNLNLGWELDLMGAAAAGSAAARADLRASQWAVRGAKLLVADEVARQWLLLQSLDRGEALAQAIVDTWDRTAVLLEARVREGTASALDLQRLEVERAGAKSRLPGFVAERDVLIDRLALLLGQPPGADLGLPPATAPLPFDPAQPQSLLQPEVGLLADPGNPPVGQPADLLLRRPDLQAAASQVTAELQRQRQAHADRYPHVFLSALFGIERLNLNSVAYSPARYSNAALAFSAPLFDAGRLEAQEAVQAARAGEAQIAWEQEVLRAVEEVDTSLAQLKGQRARCLALEEARERALAALQRVRVLQREGESDALSVLELVRTTFLAQSALLDAERDRGLAAIQLYAALGGGWPEIPKETADEP